MGNPQRGQFSFQAGDNNWTMEFTPNGFCELEGVMGKKTPAILEEFARESESGQLSFVTARRIFWAGLIEHHEGITERDAGRVMRDLGGVGPAIGVLERAVGLAFPDSVKGDEPGKGTAAAP